MPWVVLAALVLAPSARAQTLDLTLDADLGSASMLHSAFGTRLTPGLVGRAGIFEATLHSGVGVYTASQEAPAISALFPAGEFAVLSMGQTRVGGWARVHTALAPRDVQRCDERWCRWLNWEVLGPDAGLTWATGGGLWIRARPYELGSIDVVLGIDMVPLWDFVSPFPRLQVGWTLPTGFRVGARLDLFGAGIFFGRQLRLSPGE